MCPSYNIATNGPFCKIKNSVKHISFVENQNLLHLIKSLSSSMPAKSLELKHSIQLIQLLDKEIEANISLPGCCANLAIFALKTYGKNPIFDISRLIVPTVHDSFFSFLRISLKRKKISIRATPLANRNCILLISFYTP